jgi:hypothetical protein
MMKNGAGNSFWFIYCTLLKYLWCRIIKKMKFEFPKSGWGLSFPTEKNWIAHEIWTLKSNFELTDGNFVEFCIAVQNFKENVWFRFSF